MFHLNPKTTRLILLVPVFQFDSLNTLSLSNIDKGMCVMKLPDAHTHTP